MKNKLCILLLVFSMGQSCSKTKSPPPIEVLEKTVQAFHQKNSKEFISHLSQNYAHRMSESLHEILNAFARLPKSALKGVALEMGVPLYQVTRINLEEYIQYRMENENFTLGKDFVVFPAEVLQPVSVKDTEESDEKTTLIFESGEKLIFIKENGFWKIDEYIGVDFKSGSETIEK